MPRISAAHIIVPTTSKLPAAPVAAETSSTVAREELIDGLGEMLDSCGPEINRNDRPAILIEACVEQGINAVGQIIRVAGHFGFKREHVGAFTKTGRRWRNDKGLLTLTPYRAAFP